MVAVEAMEETMTHNLLVEIMALHPQAETMEMVLLPQLLKKTRRMRRFMSTATLIRQY
jgi:hypothetical protein